GADLDVALRLSQREGDGSIRQRARYLDEQPTRKDDGARPLDLAGEAHLESKLHVGGAQAGFAVDGDQDAGEGLKRRAGGDRPGDDQEGVEEGLPCGVDLHWALLGAPRSSKGCGWRGYVDSLLSRFSQSVGSRSIETGARRSAVISSSACERPASSRAPRSILRMAWMTVVWSRRLKASAIAGRERSVSSRVRYMASWRARTTGAVRLGESMTSTATPSLAATARWMRGASGSCPGEGSIVSEGRARSTE